MLEITYDEEVTIRRVATRDGRNAVTYQEVRTPDDDRWPLKCRVSRRAGRAYQKDKTELTFDATLVYIDDGAPPLRPEDLVVDKDLVVYRVSGIERETQWFSGQLIARARLLLYRESVPSDGST